MTTPTDTQSTAIPFIYLENERFIVSQEAKKFLSEIKNPICVLTIVGKYRTGKSLFLNRIILGKSKAFKVSPTINSCTRGLWLWKDTLKFENDGQEKEVLIIDTEGFGATEESDAYNNKILLFALLLSSYFVYNSVGSIDENSLNTISVLANLANEIQSKNSKDENIEQYFPSFLWLVRDFTLNLVDKNDFPIQPKEYLEQALEIQKGTSNLIEGKNRIRRMMKHFFTDRDCFTLVRPVETEDKLQQLDTLEESDFRETFLYQARSLRQKILTRIKPKRLKNTLLTGESLFELAENYVEVINSNSLPNFESSYKHLLKVEMGGMKRNILSQCEMKAKEIVRQSLEQEPTIKSYEEFNIVTQTFISETEKLSKERIKSHHSLSPFINSEEIISLINEIKQSTKQLVEKHLTEYKEQANSEYLSVITSLKEDNMMSQELEYVKNKKEFTEIFINTLNEELNNLIFENKRLHKCPQFILHEFRSIHFLPYVEEMEDQFDKLSQKRLEEEAKELKIRLSMREESLREKEFHIKKIEHELKEERLMKSQVELSLKLVESQFLTYKSNSEQKEHTLIEAKHLLEEQLNKLQSESIHLNHRLQSQSEQIKSLESTINEKSHDLNFVEKELAIIKERLESKCTELEEKNHMIETMTHEIDEKTNKIESLLTRIEELREAKEMLYEQFMVSNKELSIRCHELERTNIKFEGEIKELNKIMEKSECHFTEIIKLLNENIKEEKERYQEILFSNKRLTETIKHLQEQSDIYNKKEEKYKSFKKCIKNSSSIQCLHCTRFFMSSIFLTHLSICASFNHHSAEERALMNDSGNNNNNINVDEIIEFHVTNVLLNENNGKPFTVYQMECVKGENKWLIEKKFTEFCELNENLHTELPGVELSSANTIFDPKYLSKKSLSVEEKQFLIERYFNDLAKNIEVKNNKYWQEFIYPLTTIKQDHDHHLSSSQPVTRRTALTELPEMNTKNSQALNYQMRKSQFKEEPSSLKSSNNNSQSLKRESLQTPEEFFKIWEQKQLRSKASSTCLKKTMQN